MTTTQAAFTSPLETLSHCQLSCPPTPEQALTLAMLLAASDPWLTLNISATALEKYLLRDDPALRRYVVQVGSDVVGVMCVRYPWLRGPYIELLGIGANYRGLGIGKELLAWAEAQARRGSKNLWVVTSAFNHNALRFYQQQGFKQVGVIPALVCPDYDEILLRKNWD